MFWDLFEMFLLFVWFVFSVFFNSRILTFMDAATNYVHSQW